MSFFEALILGLVQGLTEFLPVSSSGHLVLIQKAMGVEDVGITFEIMVHFATLLSVVIYFRSVLGRMVLAIVPPFQEKYQRERRLIGLLAIGTVPAVIAGLCFRNTFEATYENPQIVSLLLLATGAILFLPRLIPAKKEGGEVKLGSAIVMGIGQAFAILPGISRSGSTIVAGLMTGVKSEDAAEFSFLLAIPAISAAMLLATKEILEEGIETALLMNYVAGGIVAFLSGLLAIYTVLVAVRKGRFEWFSYYCFAAGIGFFIFFKNGGTVG